MKPGAQILIVSDAWQPQVNGVVRTISATRQCLEERGYRVSLLTPDQFRSVPCPSYPEIRLAMTTPARVGRTIRDISPDAIHIATEGPLGLMARRWCLANGCDFTTAFHTQFPDYVAARTPVSADRVWRYIRWFHAPAVRILTATESLRAQLRARGLTRLAHWGRGVDQSVFHAGCTPHAGIAALPRPIMLSVGRVAVEKNLGAILALDMPGTKVVVGDGPALAELARSYPDARFLGVMHGAELASAYAAADVFVFPSRTDTFGMVMIEAMACGTPVAAFDVPGPIDVVPRPGGVVDQDLARAVRCALKLDRTGVATATLGQSWSKATDQFLDALVPALASPERAVA